MRLCGYGKVFSTVNSGQYDTIGAFWDEMAEIFGLENLYGLGLNWTGTTMEYIIGLKNHTFNTAPQIDGVTYKEVELPDENWETAHGLTEELSSIYDGIYKSGALKYEIECFFENGSCIIKYYR